MVKGEVGEVAARVVPMVEYVEDFTQRQVNVAETHLQHLSASMKQLHPLLQQALRAQVQQPVVIPRFHIEAILDFEAAVVVIFAMETEVMFEAAVVDVVNAHLCLENIGHLLILKQCERFCLGKHKR